MLNMFIPFQIIIDRNGVRCRLDGCGKLLAPVLTLFHGLLLLELVHTRIKKKSRPIIASFITWRIYLRSNCDERESGASAQTIFDICLSYFHLLYLYCLKPIL